MAGFFVMDAVFYSQLCWLPSCIFGHPFYDHNTLIFFRFKTHDKTQNVTKLEKKTKHLP
jgi:hypothetical protein